MKTETKDCAEVELPPEHDETFMYPNDFPVDIHVEYDGRTRLMEVSETDCDDPAVRMFTIDGGIPKEFLDDAVVNGIAQKLGLHMQSVVRIR